MVRAVVGMPGEQRFWRDFGWEEQVCLEAWQKLRRAGRRGIAETSVSLELRLFDPS